MNLQPSDLQLLTTDETARFLGVRSTTVRYWRSKGGDVDGPPFFMLPDGGTRPVARYPLPYLVAWLRDHTYVTFEREAPDAWDMPLPEPLNCDSACCLTPEEAGRLLGVSVADLRRWRHGLTPGPPIPFVRYGRRSRYPSWLLQPWLAFGLAFVNARTD